ncbi:hypothetical protein GGX14DRAFT_404574 [Mycena pura]|uniref:Uncharacterized protein n=1 Tax=Mycena pura TaxID=153505 RepID=A0AAD6UVF4_9AGAR|nr:hypothetical protein GGX14DRAFT_404572 [Mycena pura]KAJ7194529.1 hypothetical protein GGX14DRAFT_404574 [Mycena pura]
MGWDRRHRKIMAAAACYQGNCLRILCKLETFSQELRYFEWRGDHLGPCKWGVGRDCDVTRPACLPSREQVHGVQERPACSAVTGCEEDAVCQASLHEQNSPHRAGIDAEKSTQEEMLLSRYSSKISAADIRWQSMRHVKQEVLPHRKRSYVMFHGKEHMACILGFRGHDRVVARKDIKCGTGLQPVQLHDDVAEHEGKDYVPKGAKYHSIPLQCHHMPWAYATGACPEYDSGALHAVRNTPKPTSRKLVERKGIRQEPARPPLQRDSTTCWQCARVDGYAWSLDIEDGLCVVIEFRTAQRLEFRWPKAGV